MSTQTSSRPVGVDELKRAWDALAAGEFRTGHGAGKGPRGRGTAAADNWSPAAGEHTIAVIGSAGSVGASTIALATGLAAAGPVRVIGPDEYGLDRDGSQNKIGRFYVNIDPEDFSADAYGALYRTDSTSNGAAWSSEGTPWLTR